MVFDEKKGKKVRFLTFFVPKRGAFLALFGVFRLKKELKK